MYDYTNIGSPVIVLIFSGGAGGIAYALHSLVVHHPKLYGTEASE
jgi:hypothetical protein